MAPWLQAYSEEIEDLNCRIIFNQQISPEEDLFGMINSSLKEKESLEYYEHPN